MKKYYKVTMYIEADGKHVENDAIADLHIRDLLENSEAIHNCDIESCREIEPEEAGIY